MNSAPLSSANDVRDAAYHRNQIKSLCFLALLAVVLVAAALLSPVVELDMQALPEAIARYGEAARAVADGAEEEADRLNRTIIERECAAYILDKADALGLSASEASVTARWSEEGFWYPWECRVSCAEGGRAALSRAIEAELGIPPERQSWEEST